MFAYLNNDRRRRPIFAVGYSLLLLTLLWAFLSTADGPVVNFSSNAGSIGYSQTPRLVAGEYGGQPEAALVGVLQDEPPVIHASFLLFEFKQTFRLWPVLAGESCRSPPLSKF